MQALPLVRVGLYGVLFFSSFILFCLCCAHLTSDAHWVYTKDVKFIFVSTIVSMGYGFFGLRVIFGRLQSEYTTRVWHEALALFLLWISYSISAVTVANWPEELYNPHCGAIFTPCRVLHDIAVFTCLCWADITALLGALALAVRSAEAEGRPAWGGWMHGRAGGELDRWVRLGNGPSYGAA